MKIAVGSLNPGKVEAVRQVCDSWLGEVEVVGADVASGVAEQPKGRAIAEGASTRAAGALEQVEGAVLGVGIEAGLMWWDPPGRWMDIQWCTIIDSSGEATYGHGGGFTLPPRFEERILIDGLALGEVIDEVLERRGVGYAEGVIGWLSAGRMDRTELTTQAVKMALLHRLPDGPQVLDTT